MSPAPTPQATPRKPRRRPLSGVTRYVVIPLLFLTLGIRIGMFVEARRRPASPGPPKTVGTQPAETPATTRPPAAARSPRCEVSLTFENNLYPSLLLSIGTAYPEYLRCLRLDIRNTAPGQAYSLRIDSGLFLQPLEYSAMASAAEFSIAPDLPWNFEALRRVTQARPESFVVALTVDGRAADQETLTCIVHSVNEAVARLFNQASGQWQDTSVCFAAYVNENHPWINGLLQEAQSRSGLQAFSGYQSGTPEVMAEIQAVWDALAARGLHYVNLSTENGASPGVSTQYVRFLDQSVQDQGANCVDASVLFASIFRRIGLRPVLVFKPGHCLVALYDAAEGGRLIALETTLLSSASAAAAETAGTQELQAALPNLGSLQYSMVDIAQARQLGISPIAFEPASR